MGNIIFNIKNYSQGEGTLTSATFQQSAYLIGTGQLGVALPTDEIMGYYFNPAILGYTAKENHASFAFMPGKTDCRNTGQSSPLMTEYWSCPHFSPRIQFHSRIGGEPSYCCLDRLCWKDS